MLNIGFLGRWCKHACPQCLPSDTVPIRSWTRTLNFGRIYSLIFSQFFSKIVQGFQNQRQMSVTLPHSVSAQYHYQCCFYPDWKPVKSIS